jgi:hypothetical protein
MNTSRARHLASAARLAVLACLALVVLVAAPAATSNSPRQVDPLTMTPALNPDFAPWSCWEAGTGITCQGEYNPTYNENIGPLCGGTQDVWISGSGHERMTRWHTADGLATKTRVHLSYPADTFSLSETGDGPTFVISGQWNRHYEYPIPGDRASRVFTERGLIYLGRANGQQVFHDSGTVTFAPDEEFETITVLHGLHDFYGAYPDQDLAIDSAICAALG